MSHIFLVSKARQISTKCCTFEVYLSCNLEIVCHNHCLPNCVWSYIRAELKIDSVVLASHVSAFDIKDNFFAKMNKPQVMFNG